MNALLDTIKQRQVAADASAAAADAGRRNDALRVYRRILGQGEPSGEGDVTAFCAACNVLTLATSDIEGDLLAIERSRTYFENLAYGRAARSTIPSLREAWKTAAAAAEEAEHRFRRAVAQAHAEAMALDELRQIARAHPRVLIVDESGPRLHPAFDVPSTDAPSTPDPTPSEPEAEPPRRRKR